MVAHASHEMNPAPGPGSPVVITGTRRQRLLNSFGFMAALSLGLMFSSLRYHPDLEGVFTSALTTLMLVGGFGTASYFWQRKERIELSPAGILVVTRFKTTFLNWVRVQQIYQYQILGVTMLKVIGDGQAVKIYAPSDSFWLWRDPDFTAKVEGIFAWWYAVRGWHGPLVTVPALGYAVPAFDPIPTGHPDLVPRPAGPGGHRESND